jgi:uncharacterized protein
MARLTRRDVLGGTLATCLFGGRSQGAQRMPGPPLWVVERAGSKVFLLGQMPVRAGDEWLTPRIQQAFDTSAELWVENPEPPAAAGGPPPVSEAPAGPKLSEVGTARDLERVHAALSKAGMPADSLDALPPSLAYFPIADLADRALGADFAAIPERVLRARAKQASKPVHSEWASFEQVSRFLDDLSGDLRVRIHLQMIARALDELEDTEAAEQRLREWLAGDVRGFEALDRRMRSLYPDARQYLGTRRNIAWVLRIRSMLSRTPAAFVCVGVGHLVGPDSIQAHARKAGLMVRRL